MAYKIKYNGYDVECDTADDLRELLSKNGDKPSTSAVAPQQHPPIVERPSTGMAALVTKLRKEQRDLLRLIAMNAPIPRDRLIQMAGSLDHREFAGRLIGISKSAAGAGVESPIEKLTERVNGRGPRIYQYKIRDGVKAEVKAALAQ